LTWHLKPSQTFTDTQLRASCRAVSLPGTAIAPPATAWNSRGWCSLPNASLGANVLHHVGHLHHPKSQEGQEDNQGQQPAEPLPIHM
jgi:hypothetical protein